MALRGDLSSIKALKSKIKALPTSLAHGVASKAAPALTDLTVEAFTSGRSVYGDARPVSREDGLPLSLVKSGKTRRTLQFVANGTIVRCVLGTKYARFLIGKYGILPNGALPVKWSAALGALVAEAAKAAK